MGDNSANNEHLSHNRAFALSIDSHPQGDSTFFADDGHLKRTGTVQTATAYIITAVIGSGVLPLAWATAQLGWIAGPILMLLSSFVTYYTSTLLAACHRSEDPVTGKRNYTYMDAVRSNLGGARSKVCGLVLYLNLLGVAIGNTIVSSTSVLSIQKSICRHNGGDSMLCHMSSNTPMISFGIIQVIFSQIFDFDRIRWLSTVVTLVMSCTYSTIGLGLSVAKVAETGKFKGSLTGISIGSVTETQKIWRSLQALGYIAFAYSYSNVQFEIEDTLKSPPSEAKTMKKASRIGFGVATLFYMLFGCFGYAAFGDLSPQNLFTGLGFRNPYWLINIANAAIVINLVSAYQVYCQPLFLFVEKHAAERFPDTEFIKKEIKVPIPGFRRPYNLNVFCLVWRTILVIISTLIPLLFPFFNEVVGLLGALGFWPLTVYFPVEMHIKQKKIQKWSTKWIGFQILSFACLIISIAAAIGSLAGVVVDLRTYEPFKSINTPIY